MSGWILVNIVAPVLLPVLGILPLQALPLGSAAGHLRPIATVKDGQLCWAAVAMGVASIHELWMALTSHKMVPEWCGIALAVVITVMLASMVLAAGGAAFSTTLLTQRGISWRAWLAHYRVLAWSACMCAIASIAEIMLHSAFTVP